MADWGAAYDDQCRKEGVEVPEKTPQDSSNLEMEQNEENKGVKSGVGRGGAFGAPKTAPPPQTSFGATSATRVGGSFGTTTGPDGRGTPIGSPDEGGNVISVSTRKTNSHPTTTSFGTTNRTPLKTNSTEVGGRFGSLALKTTAGGAFGARSTGQENKEPVQRVGGAFGAPKRLEAPAAALEVPETPKLKVGGGFGNSNSTPLVVESSDQEVTPKAKVGGGFGRPAPPVESSEPKVVGGGFGAAKPIKPLESDTPKVKLGGGFGSVATKPVTPETTVGGGFGGSTSKPEVPKVTIGGGFGSSTKIGGGFGVKTEQKPPQAAPFMPGPPAPPMRGGFQGGFRGGRGAGPPNDFGAGQGHSMGRGRGQPNQQYAPQQRSTPPVVPDARYKYTKPSIEDVHEKMPVPADIALLNKYIVKEVNMMKDVEVDVLRQDPKSPLYSISSFRELRLKPEVLQALDTLNFQFPTRIQETALPLLLMEPPSNLIAQAQSGTGKTAAFVLTMLCRIDVDLQTPQCICLAPTLELAKQIGEVVEKMGKFMDKLRIHYAIKGANMAAMRGRKLTEQIVIGTPGITRDYLVKYKCIDPSAIRCLVLDEADVMIYHQGFTDISTTIYNMVEEASESVQSMLFSATYDTPVIEFATKIIKNAIVVMLKREEQALPNIKQFYVQCACRDSKYAAIVNLYSGLAVASSVIFCHTKASVMWLFENMKARGHQVDVLHGDMTVVERADAIIRFKRGDFKVLITTNVFARGIDVAQVSVVINYDLPIKYNESETPLVIDGRTQPDCETYLHRIGRTGRFGKTGIAINLIDSDDSMNMINVLEAHFQMKISRMDPSNLVELEAIEMA